MNAIGKFISGLNEGQKKLLIITVVIVIAACFDRLLIAPTMSRLSSIEEDIAKEEASIRQDMHFLGYRDRIAREGNEIGPFLTKNMSTDEEMIAAFLKKVESLAGQTKITVIKINPAPSVQDAEYWKYQADLECSGQLADVVSFMHLVNSDGSLMKVLKFNFSSKPNTDEIKATMTIEKIVVTEKPMPANAPQTSPSVSL